MLGGYRRRLRGTGARKVSAHSTTDKYESAATGGAIPDQDSTAGTKLASKKQKIHENGELVMDEMLNTERLYGFMTRIIVSV